MNSNSVDSMNEEEIKKRTKLWLFSGFPNSLNTVEICENNYEKNPK